MNNVSVIIPSYNTQSVIAGTLDNLSQQMGDINVEIIVVDCSESDEVEKIVSQYPNTVCIREKQRFNPGIGRNIGANKAKSDLLVFVDADVMLSQDCLLAALKEYESGKKAFGGALELNIEKSDGLSAYFEHFFFNHEAQVGRSQQKRKNLSSALMCIERETFISHGGFKNIARMQDTEFSERLLNEGIELHFCPTLVAYQTQNSPLKSVFRKIFINGRNLYSIRYRDNVSLGVKIGLYLFLPVLSSAKGFRIILRHLRYQNLKNKLRTLLLSPLLMSGIFVWMSGFYFSMLLNTPVSDKR